MVGRDVTDEYMLHGHNVGHISLYWLCWPYHNHTIISSATFLRCQKNWTRGYKHPTPMIALFVNPSSPLRAPFLPCLLGVKSVPFINQYSLSTREEKTSHLKCCVGLPMLEYFVLSLWQSSYSGPLTFIVSSPPYPPIPEYTYRSIQLLMSYKIFLGL